MKFEYLKGVGSDRTSFNAYPIKPIGMQTHFHHFQSEEDMLLELGKLGWELTGIRIGVPSVGG